MDDLKKDHVKDVEQSHAKRWMAAIWEVQEDGRVKVTTKAENLNAEFAFKALEVIAIDIRKLVEGVSRGETAPDPLPLAEGFPWMDAMQEEALPETEPTAASDQERFSYDTLTESSGTIGAEIVSPENEGAGE